MSEPPVLFLDANTLASPVTRTLVIAGAREDGLRWTWSQAVEIEADRHARGRASSTSSVRSKILGTELSASAPDLSGLVTSSAADRQVIAEAIAAGARYLITADVDDFAFADLAGHRMSAVNPDRFMALRFSESAYRVGVELLATVQKNPPRTVEDVHRALGWRHPELSARFAGAFSTAPHPADHDQPRLRFRGVACIRCAATLSGSADSATGLCGVHTPL